MGSEENQSQPSLHFKGRALFPMATRNNKLASIWTKKCLTGIYAASHVLLSAFLGEAHAGIRATHASARAQKAKPAGFPEEEDVFTAHTVRGLQASPGASLGLSRRAAVLVS